MNSTGAWDGAPSVGRRNSFGSLGSYGVWRAKPSRDNQHFGGAGEVRGRISVEVAMVIRVNRAPVMTLWAAVVAEHLGFDEDEALSIGKTVAGLNAQAKGVRLGIYIPDPKELKMEREKPPTEEVLRVDVLHRAVSVVRTKDGLRALSHAKPVSPGSVRRYLASKFKDELPAVKAAMNELADAVSPENLAARGYELYEAFRPAIPAGVKGWGAEGDLDLEKVRSLASK